ncbi:MAG: hypothetical protein ABIN01_19915 [Ferruginibacter sp.]
MAETILLLLSIFGLTAFLLYISIKGTKLSKKAVLISVMAVLIFIVLLFYYTGPAKIKSDIARVIRNSSPKKGTDVYTLLFGKPAGNCMTVINFKDQVIPTIDCCIWMELRLCPTELNRIITLKNYHKTRLNKLDSTNFLHSFTDRPLWWTPQLLGDSLTKFTFIINEDKEQTLFWGDDSAHLYLCDKAL